MAIESFYNTQRFISVHTYYARYRTQQSEQIILLETRTKSDRSRQIFTIINDEQVRATSIQALLLMRPDCKSLSISHEVSVVWDNSIKNATLIEIFSISQSLGQVSVSLVLEIDGISYSTSECVSFTEAVDELREITGHDKVWRLQTCFDCRFSRPAFLDPTDDREELRCYRDAPEAFEDVQARSKFASQEALSAGDYFVDAFHKCAGWQSI